VRETDRNVLAVLRLCYGMHSLRYKI
jgi:hypothetical protein